MEPGSKLSATDNVDYQPETENSRYYVTDNSQGRKAKEERLYPSGDYHGGGHDQRTYYYAKSKSVGNVLQGVSQSTEICMLKSYIQFTPINFFYDLPEPRGQLSL